MEVTRLVVNCLTGLLCRAVDLWQIWVHTPVREGAINAASHQHVKICNHHSVLPLPLAKIPIVKSPLAFTLGSQKSNWVFPYGKEEEKKKITQIHAGV